MEPNRGRPGPDGPQRQHQAGSPRGSSEQTGPLELQEGGAESQTRSGPPCDDVPPEKLQPEAATGPNAFHCVRRCALGALGARAHAAASVHSCALCGKEFCSASRLTSHQRIHSGEKPFGCERCGKRFARPDNLKTHQSAHSGEKCFACGHCGSLYRYSSSLSRHLRLHSGRLFCCDRCSKSYTSSSALLCHRRSHTGEKPFSCELCGRMFCYQQMLQRHKCPGAPAGATMEL